MEIILEKNILYYRMYIIFILEKHFLCINNIKNITSFLPEFKINISLYLDKINDIIQKKMTYILDGFEYISQNIYSCDKLGYIYEVECKNGFIGLDYEIYSYYEKKEKQFKKQILKNGIKINNLLFKINYIYNDIYNDMYNDKYNYTCENCFNITIKTIDINFTNIPLSIYP